MSVRPTLTLKQMQAHLDELAAECGVRLETWSGAPGAAPGAVDAEARLVLSDPPVILTKPLRNRYQYLAGLHEFGHLIVGMRGPAPQYGLRPVHLVDEVAAWVWAFDNSRVEITPRVERYVRGVLFTCAFDAGAARVPGDSYGINAVPDELRDEYVAGLVRLGVPADRLGPR